MKIISLTLVLLATGFCSGAWARTVTAASGTPSAVQAAIDSAASGDTVVIPAGNYTWTNGVSVNKFIKLKAEGVVLTNAQGENWNTQVMALTAQSAGSVELSGLKIVRGDSVSYHLTVSGTGRPVLVHDCAFESNRGGAGHCIQWRTNGGVLWHCNFTAKNGADMGGVAFKNPSSDSAWKAGSTLGVLDVAGTSNTYMEDCTFKDVFLQACDFDDNSRTVVRHNVFDNSGMTSHGMDTSPVGTRQWEIYDNTYIFTASPSPYPLNLNYWFYVRGGTGIIWNNQMPDIKSQMWGDKPEIWLTVYNIRRAGAAGCQTEYPAKRQVGFGSDEAGQQVSDPIYIWGNTGGANYDNPNLTDYNPDDCGNNLHTSDFVKKGRDYFTGTAKPGYTPYPYPHPLRAGFAGPTPTPPEPNPSPSVSPTPTPTPAPTATPTPTPIPTPPMLPPGTYRIPEGSTITAP